MRQKQEQNPRFNFQPLPPKMTCFFIVQFRVRTELFDQFTMLKIRKKRTEN